MEGVARARRRLSLRRIEKGFSILFPAYPGRRLALRSLAPSITDRRQYLRALCSHRTTVLLKPTYINVDRIEFIIEFSRRINSFFFLLSVESFCCVSFITRGSLSKTFLKHSFLILLEAVRRLRKIRMYKRYFVMNFLK